MIQPGLPYGLTKRAQFFLRAFGEQLYAAIGQIANSSRNFKTGGNGFDGISKPDALHAARIKNMHPLAIHTSACVHVIQLSDPRKENQPLHRSDGKDEAIACHIAQ